MNFKGTFSVTITPTKYNGDINVKSLKNYFNWQIRKKICLLYTSDAADDSLRVDLGGRRIIKKI